LFAVAFLFPYKIYATPVDIRVLDKTKAGFQDVLVIVQSLPEKNEIFRMLTDANGNMPRHNFIPGLYRIIATCPYGPCETLVREILICQEDMKVDLILDLKPIINESWIYDPGSHLKIKILEADGSVSQGARIIVRDELALEEVWYITDTTGSAIVGMTASENSTVVVVTSNQLETRTLLKDEIRNLQRKHALLVIRLPAKGG
jgi:hypothetical protein